MSWGPQGWRNGKPPEFGPLRNCYSVQSTAYFRQRVKTESMAADKFKGRYGIAIVPPESETDPESQLANSTILANQGFAQARRRRFACSRLKLTPGPVEAPDETSPSHMKHRTWAVTDTTVNRWKTDMKEGHPREEWTQQSPEELAKAMAQVEQEIRELTKKRPKPVQRPATRANASRPASRAVGSRAGGPRPSSTLPDIPLQGLSPLKDSRAASPALRMSSPMRKVATPVGGSPVKAMAQASPSKPIGDDGQLSIASQLPTPVQAARQQNSEPKPKAVNVFPAVDRPALAANSTQPGDEMFPSPYNGQHDELVNDVSTVGDDAIAMQLHRVEQDLKREKEKRLELEKQVAVLQEQNKGAHRKARNVPSFDIMMAARKGRTKQPEEARPVTASTLVDSVTGLLKKAGMIEKRLVEIGTMK